MVTPSAMTSSETVFASRSSKSETSGTSATGGGGAVFGNLCIELMQFSTRRSRESNTRALEPALHVAARMAIQPTARVLPHRRRALRLPRHLARRVPRRWRAGLHQHPRARRQIGVRTVWAKVRQIIFAWWIWAIAAIVALVYDNWGWAIGTGSHVGVRVPRMAERSAPSRRSRTRVQRRRRRVPDDDCGIDGHSVLRGKRDRDSEQRRRVLPGDAEEPSRWRNAPSPSRRTSTGRAISAGGSRKRSPPRRRRASA